MGTTKIVELYTQIEQNKIRNFVIYEELEEIHEDIVDIRNYLIIHCFKKMKMNFIFYLFAHGYIDNKYIINNNNLLQTAINYYSDIAVINYLIEIGVDVNYKCLK